MEGAASRLLGGRYRLGVLVGEGAVSTVSCAQDELLQRTVAVKLLKPAYAQDEAFVARFYAEARMAAKVVHPNVVAIYDISTDRTSHAIVMEYVEGPPLSKRLESDGEVPEEQLLDYARQVAQALSVAHAQGILHRDIKPANLLLASDDVLKVADFGLAKAASPNDFTISQPGQMIGSVHYFSPEQAQGKALTPASDLYSLGIVIYQLASGDVPFNGDSAISVALAQVQQPTPSLTKLRTFMSPGLAAVVHRLLQKDPARRYASATDLDAALAELQPATAPAYRLDAPTIISPAALPSQPPLLAQVAPVFEDASKTIAAGAGSFFQWARRRSRTHVEPALKRSLTSLSERARAVRISLPAILWSVLALLVLGALISSSFGKSVSVPDLRNKPLAIARRELEAAGLVPNVTLRPNDRLRDGYVIAQKPAPRALLRKGKQVELTVSAGLPLVSIPNLVGHSLAFAARTLAALKLRTSYAARISQTEPNTVIEQIPAPGTRVRQRSTALIIISAGPQPRVIYSDGEE